MSSVRRAISSGAMADAGVAVAASLAAIWS